MRKTEFTGKASSLAISVKLSPARCRPRTSKIASVRSVPGAAESSETCMGCCWVRVAMFPDLETLPPVEFYPTYRRLALFNRSVNWVNSDGNASVERSVRNRRMHSTVALFIDALP